MIANIMSIGIVCVKAVEISTISKIFPVLKASSNFSIPSSLPKPGGPKTPLLRG